MSLEARGFHYNLVTSTFDFEQITLKGVGLHDMPAPLRRSAFISLPVWKLAFGSVAAAKIRVQGLVARWTAEQTAKATGHRSRGAAAISWTVPRC